MSAFPTLQTQRLVLRQIVETDAETLFAIHGDAERMKWFGNDPLPNLEAAQKMISNFAGWRDLSNPGTRWGIEIKGQSGLVGTCGLFAWNRNFRKCTLGYELAKEVEGKGLMTEALQCVVAWGWAEMGLNRIEAQVHPENQASIALLRRLNFTEEGKLRQGSYWSGSFHDMFLYALLHQDWKSHAVPGDA